MSHPRGYCPGRLGGLLMVLALVSAPASTSIASAQSPADRVVERAFQALTPRQRVGQLLLVAFSRREEEGPLADAHGLVTTYGVGGLILQKGNLIFRNERGIDLPGQIAALTGELQAAALGTDGPGVPLFIAVDHEGNGDPTTHLREGFTTIPSAMAIGATWDPASAEAIGRIVGRELAAVGVNLLLGPGLDVLAEPRASRGDIGTRSFGGDPYWVGQMGQAYIRGVHLASQGRVATVAKHFPGHGGSDRLPDEEVATVNKSLAELRRIELPPFAAVTSRPPGPGAPAVTDALMTSHIRYRGFQGNIRKNTKPISIDPEALWATLNLDGFPFGSWHRGGGLIVADSLGVRAIRRFDDPSGETFRHRDITRKALEAGNDLLILAQFATTPAWSVQLENIQDVIRYLEAQYRSDAALRSRIDEAVRRVLARKAAVYPQWTLEAVAVDPQEAAAVVGTDEARQTVATISRRAVTRLRGQDHPLGGQRIVIVTDDSDQLACRGESCGLPPQRHRALDRLGDTLVEALLLERYGPRGTGLVQPQDLLALRFCQLRLALGPATAEPPVATPAPGERPSVPESEICPGRPGSGEVRSYLEAADWIVFAFGDLTPLVVRDLTGFYLPQVTGLVQAASTRVAVLSFGPPYYIDATNFALLDTFITAYSKIPASIEAALEVLFGDRVPTGAPPVSLRDADYELTEVLEPDPARPFPLRLVEEPTAGPNGQLPAVVTVEVGPILDHNGHPVPDDTEVELSSDPVQALAGGPVRRARTVNGRARLQLVFPTGGQVKLQATSGQADAQAPLVLIFPQPTPTPSPAPGPGAGAPGTGAVKAGRPPLGPAQLLLALAASVLLNGTAMASGRWRHRPLEEQLRSALLATSGGLVGYLFYGGLLQFVPGAPGILSPGLHAAATVAASLGGAAAGLALSWRPRSGPTGRPPRG